MVRRKAGVTPEARTDELLDRVGLLAVAEDRVDSLPTGLARLVEVGRALASRAEGAPARRAVVGAERGGDRHLRASCSRGWSGRVSPSCSSSTTCELVMRVCARIHVLDFGQVIAVGTPAEVQRDPHVQAAYLGTGVE